MIVPPMGDPRRICPINACIFLVKRPYFLCRTHWHTLPHDMRLALWRAKDNERREHNPIRRRVLAGAFDTLLYEAVELLDRKGSHVLS